MPPLPPRPPTHTLSCAAQGRYATSREADVKLHEADMGPHRYWLGEDARNVAVFAYKAPPADTPAADPRSLRANGHARAAYAVAACLAAAGVAESVRQRPPPSPFRVLSRALPALPPPPSLPY